MKRTRYQIGFPVVKYLVKYPLALVLLASLCGVGSYPVQTSTPPATPITGMSNAPEQPDRGNHSVDAPVISDITTNAVGYPGGKIPRFAKFEITFQVETSAQNYQLPYDPNPPMGVTPGIGVSVEALFSPDNWQTAYTQPAFYYQEFQSETKSRREWFYPTGDYAWKVRFAPHQVGEWQYRLVVHDQDGIFQTEPAYFSVVSSPNNGFMRVSQADPRYFEFDQGGYFPALGYNMNFNHISWENPTLGNEPNFQIMAENGIQLVRIWLSEWGIYGSAWNPWNSPNPEQHGQYMPYTGLSFEQSFPGSDLSMKLRATHNPCMFANFMKAPHPVKRNTTYRVRIRYKTEDLVGPRIAGNPYGLVAKTGDWLWGSGYYCYDPGTGDLVTPHQDQNTTDWQILEGSLNSGERDFLPYLYLALENVNQGRAYIDYVWIEEDQGNGNYGPNIVTKPWMAHHLYMEQRNSFAFDQMLKLAEEYGIYIRPVIIEKNDWIFNRIDYEGAPIPDDDLCYDDDPNNDPPKCPGNNWFYGNNREMSKVRWLEQAWWRYLQARWGYSTSIHSWELLNEGDPFNGLHYTLADEFGAYMHQYTPNDHLVSTSFWHSFPKDEFWANPEYSHVDFADLHRYIPSDDPQFYDAALETYLTSMQYGALQPGGAGKPLLRGETGFTQTASEPPSAELLQDTQAIWLHNFIWGSLNPGGMIESYWYENYHIYSQNPDGSYAFDHRHHFLPFYDFVSSLPLNSGDYQDAQAATSTEELRAWGQKDLTRGQAHLWIQNRQHTWKNVVDGTPITPITGVITLTGFTPGEQYRGVWIDTYQDIPAQAILAIDVFTAQPDGSLILPVEALSTDVAVKIYPAAMGYLPLAMVLRSGN